MSDERVLCTSKLEQSTLSRLIFYLCCTLLASLDSLFLSSVFQLFHWFWQDQNTQPTNRLCVWLNFLRPLHQSSMENSYLLNTESDNTAKSCHGAAIVSLCVYRDMPHPPLETVIQTVWIRVRNTHDNMNSQRTFMQVAGQYFMESKHTGVSFMMLSGSTPGLNFAGELFNIVRLLCVLRVWHHCSINVIFLPLCSILFIQETYFKYCLK